MGATFDWFHSNPAVGLGAGMSGNVPAFTATNITLLPDTTIVSVYPTFNGCIGDTAEYLIVVNPIPAAPTVNDTLVCTNNAVTLTATAPGPVYDWFDVALGGTSLSSGPSYTTPVLSATDTFWVHSTINNCTGPRAPVIVNIGNGLIVDAGLDVDICPGDTTVLAASLTHPSNTYNWSEPGIATIDTFFNQPVWPIDTTLYTVQVTDTFGCVGFDSVTVNVKPLPTVLVPTDTSFCSGDLVPGFNYVVTPAGGTPIGNALWTNSDPSIGLAAAGSDTVPSFTAVNNSGVPVTATISVAPFRSSCAGNIETHTITIHPIPFVDTPPDSIYCIGEVVPQVNFTGTPPSTIYTWTNSNVTTGMDTSGTDSVPSFVATNTTSLPNVSTISITPSANGCTGNTSSYTVTVSSAIIIHRIIKDATCFGDNDGEIITIPSGGTANYSYAWSTGATDSIVTNLSSDSISLTVTDINNCIQDSTFYVAQPDSIDYITFYAIPEHGCSPLEVEFTCTINPVLHLVDEYIWDFGNNLLPIDSFEAKSIYIDPGSYDVSLTIKDYAGCTSTLTKKNFITVHEDPEAHFLTSPDDPTMFNPTIDFKDVSLVNIIDWHWQFDSFDTSIVQNPSYTFPKDSGTYMVTLIVEDDNTCKDTLSQIVHIRSEIAFFIPNSFTPNGDGINDVFVPKGFGISDDNYSLMIFNRWGELVFESHTKESGWDGSLNGDPLPMGIYVWRAEFSDLNGNTYRKDGQLSIIK